MFDFDLLLVPILFIGVIYNLVLLSQKQKQNTLNSVKLIAEPSAPVQDNISHERQLILNRLIKSGVAVPSVGKNIK